MCSSSYVFHLYKNSVCRNYIIAHSIFFFFLQNLYIPIKHHFENCFKDKYLVLPWLYGKKTLYIRDVHRGRKTTAAAPRRLKKKATAPLPRWFSKKYYKFNCRDCIGLEILTLDHQIHSVLECFTCKH
jgi:hypothetical protein